MMFAMTRSSSDVATRAGPPGRIEQTRVAAASEAVDETQRRAATSLRKSHDLIQAILTTAIDAIITIDARGIIQAVNPATERIFGYAEAELLGQNVSMLMPSPYRDEHDRYIARYVQTGEARVIGKGREIIARRKDGTNFPADIAINRVDGHGLFTGVVRDISDRKQAETRVRAADRMATLGTLAAGLGHDMHNVLMPVRARLNALKAAGKAGKVVGAELAHVEEIAKSIAYLQQLADALHLLVMDPRDAQGRADAGGEPGSTDLQQWWAEAGSLLSRGVPKHVRVVAKIPANLQPAGIAPHSLTQAVLNLIVNAGEAIPGPSVRKRVQGVVCVTADPLSDASGSWVRLCVCDNGIGMTDEVKRRAFEMFFTTKSRGLGTGLGLPLVRNVVERAGGRVEIDSTLGKGTSVTLILPIAQATRATNATPTTSTIRPAIRPAKRPAIEPPQPGVRLICVDDHAVLVEGLRAQFAIEGRIEIVGWLPSAEKLIPEVARLSPDVVLLDIEMPGPDAFEIADRLHHMHPGLRIAFLSAHIRDGYLTAARRCGARGYFAKGDELEDLAAGILQLARSDADDFVMTPKVRQRLGPIAASARGPRHAAHAQLSSRSPSSTDAPPREPARPATPLESLSAREIEVLRLIGKGRSRVEIAKELARSVKTIDGHQERIMKKLGIDARADLMRFAIREGLAEA